MNKLILCCFCLGLIASSFASTLSASTIHTFFNEDLEKETCTWGKPFDYSSWSSPITDNIGYHPSIKHWTYADGYIYLQNRGPKIKVDIGFGPFTYIAGKTGTGAVYIDADSNRASRLYMRVDFKTRTYKKTSSYPCNTTKTFREYKVYEERYYAKYR